MDTDRAIEIVQSLADLSAVCLRATRRQVSQAGGVDPFSGERFPSGSPYLLPAEF